jgi:hypothetical protein
MADPLLEVRNLRIENEILSTATSAPRRVGNSTGIPAPDRRIDHYGYEEPIGGCRRP